MTWLNDLGGMGAGYAAALSVLLWPGVIVRVITVSNAALELPLALLYVLAVWYASTRREPRLLLGAAGLLGLCLLTGLTLIFLAPLIFLERSPHPAADATPASVRSPLRVRTPGRPRKGSNRRLELEYAHRPV